MVSKAEYIKYSKKELEQYILNLNDLRKIWTDEAKRQQLLSDLKQKSISPNALADMIGNPDADAFDILAHVEGFPYFTSKVTPHI